MTVEEVKQEVMLFTLENIRHYPCTLSVRDDFYSLWNRFGADAARCIMIPPLFRGEVPKPSEFFKK